MGGWHGWLDRMRALLARDDEERALREEIRFHIEMETRKLLADGMGADEARREAHRRFGGVERMKERTREERGTRLLAETLHDVRFALRGLRRTPGATGAALLTLALGVGATTAMFAVVDGVLLRPLPYGDPAELVAVWEVTESGDDVPASYWNFDDWRRDAGSFEALAAFTPARGATATTASGGVRARAAAVSADFFEVVGVLPLLGRLPGPDENRPGGPAVAVVGAAFWRDALGAPDELAGVTLGIDGEVWDVVGVLPERVDVPEATDVWLPLDRRVPWSVRTNHVVHVVGRLAPGATLERARSELEASHAGIVAEHPDVESPTARARSLERELLGDVRRPLLLLLGAAAFLLLVACANVASTVLARGLGRRRELAVRASLGAGRGRLVRQLLTESVVLSGLGGVLAVPVALGIVTAATTLDPGAVPRLADVALDGRILFFTAAATLLTAVLFGTVPALQLTRELGTRLRSARGGADRRARSTWRLLMAGEVALALVLLTGAGLTLRSLSAILDRDVGFDPEGVVTGRIHLPADTYETAAEAVAWLDGLIRELDEAPGVQAAGVNLLLPVKGAGNLGSPVLLEGGERSDAVLQYRVADAGFFRALDVPLLQGRLLEGTDRSGAPHAAVIDDAMARRLWPGEDPVGKRFNPRGMDPYPDEWLTVVGVVGEVRAWNQDPGSNPTFYVSHRQRPAFAAFFGLSLVVRVDDTAEGSAFLRETVRRHDPDVPVAVSTLSAQLAGSAADRRFTGFVLGSFAAVALLLAAMGVYGVVGYTVARRTREMGIRLAVGASPTRLRGRVLAEALSVVAVGAGVGLVASALVGSGLESLLFEVSPLDPWTYLGTTGALVATAALASWVPARRSTRVDPAVTLRSE